MLLSMLITIIASVCITGLLGLGFCLIWSGICGKIVDGHPLCGNCKFDLVGHSLRPHRCPECGEIIAQAGGIVMGHRDQQVPKIVHGSILIAINLSIVGLCWWTAQRPATANGVAITQTIRIAPIPVVVSYTNAPTRNKNQEATEVATTFRQDSIDAKTPSSPITFTDVKARTIEFNVDTLLSGGLIILGDNSSGANSISLDQLILFDRQSKSGLPAQPASGVNELLVRPVAMGKSIRSIESSKYKVVADSYWPGKRTIQKKSHSISRVFEANASQRMDTNKIKAQRAAQNPLGQYDPYHNKSNNHGTARKNLSQRGR